MNDSGMRTDVLVLGSGIAGCSAALKAADAGLKVTLVTAGDDLSSGNTPLAQGGIVYATPGEDPRDLERDILTAGWKQNHIRAVRYLCRRGPQVVREMLIERLKVPFERDKKGFQLVREGGHSVPRVLFCADHTGQNIITALRKAVLKNKNITLLTRCTAIDLLTTHHHARHLDYSYSLDNHCVGAYLFEQPANRVRTVLADHTVLATGGIGQVYVHTTNTPGSIGSGLAMASRAGARILGAEYVQFHPTALYAGKRRGGQRFLVSEAVRGDGARLVDSEGRAFMQRHDSRGDLAPRDIVTRAIMEELLASGEECVFLDISRLGHDPAERFPTIYQACKEIGLDMGKDPVPVVPAAHYFCGGVLVDNHARTTLERLYCAGECSCTGVHGANRLASTSLLEGLLWGVSAGEDITKRRNRQSRLSRKLCDSIPDWQPPGDIQNEDPALIAQDWATIRNTMWNYVGISRSTDRLNRAFNDMRELSKNLHDFYKKTPISKPIIDLFHGCQAAYIITRAALRNQESRGCHHRV